MTQSLTEKYRPQKFESIQGNNSAVDEIKGWIENFEPGDSPMLLAGDRGTGKTTTAHVCSNHTGYPIVEINASSARTKDDIQNIVSEIATGSVSSEYKIILLDEVDSMSASTNHKPLREALKDPNNPVILTCNKHWEVPDGIKNQCTKHDYKLQKRSIKAKLREICEEEGFDLSNREIGKLATRGDLRSAINDLQRFGDGGDIPWNDREMEIGGFEATRNIIEEKQYTGDVGPSDLILWLDENMSDRLEGLEEAMVYDALSRADMWEGRIHERGNYHWRVYSAQLSEQVANLRLSEPYDGYIRISFPSWFRSKADTYSSNNNTVKLYKKLKREESGLYSFAGNYIYFREVLLPFIKDQSEEEKYKLVHQYSLEESEAEEIGIDYGEYEEWKESGPEVEEEPEKSEVEAEESQDSSKGVLDF